MRACVPALFGLAVLLAVGGAAGARHAGGQVTLVDRTWVCSGPVDLGSVTVTIRTASRDAVRLADGCTGRIGRIDVVQYHGDGIKVGAASDLTVESGSVRCYAHDPGKHQDGVQVMGGTRVTFRNLDVGCYSANNSQVWINDGAGKQNRPTDVVFEGGRFDGQGSGSYGVAIMDSLRSGFRNALICPNAHPRRQMKIGDSATDPVNEGNTLAEAC